MGTEILDEIFDVIKDRIERPKEDSYVCRLLSEGRAPDKVKEESEELLEAAATGLQKEIIHETADLLFHVMVLIGEKGVELNDVMEELKRRRRK